MRKYKPVDLRKIKTYSAKNRKTKVEVEAFAKLSPKGSSFRKFYDSLPDFLAVKSLKESVNAIVKSYKNGRPVVIGIGAHVVKVGLNPIIIDLMRRKIATCIVMHGAGAIHDFEIATLGTTSEEVGKGLDVGMFGMVEETMKNMNAGINKTKAQEGQGGPGKVVKRGLGERLGEKLVEMKAPYRNLSILANGVNLNIPVTVHVAIGTDTIHMSPYTDPKALGEASFVDFQILCSVLSNLEGGVYLNIGSAVILPEVYLKALNVARNLGNKIKHFTTINLDMIQHYRPTQNVLSRPGGTAFAITGHHEIIIPLLYQSILESL